MSSKPNNEQTKQTPDRVNIDIRSYARLDLKVMPACEKVEILNQASYHKLQPCSSIWTW